MDRNFASGRKPIIRTHHLLARQMGREILSGDYKPGESPGGEVERSTALGVSRSVYREAVQILIAKGLLESRPKAGTRVTPRRRWNLLDPDILAWMFMGEPDPSFVRDLFELRGVIEPAAAAFAAERRTEGQLAGMRECLAEMGGLGLATERGQAADREFHRIILEASQNEAMISLAGSIGAAVQWTTHFKQRLHDVPRDPSPEHGRLFDAIEARDGDRARLATIELLEFALRDMDATQK